MVKIVFFSLFFIFLSPLFSNENIIDSNLKKYLTQEEINYIHNKKIITVSNEFDYEPMDFNINGTPIGYSIDLLNLLTKDAGLKINYVTKTWVELLNDFKNKKIDLMHTIYKTSEREKKFAFSKEYLIGENYYIVRNSSKDIKNISDLFGKKLP